MLSVHYTFHILLKLSSLSVNMRALALLCVLHGIFGASDSYSWNGPGATTASYNDWCKNDAGSCGCCTMVKELNVLENYFNGKIETLKKEYQQTRQSLIATDASKTAFSVALFNQQKCFGPFRSNTNVKYEQVFINRGNAYDTTTGIFTVKYAGVYSIALTVYSDAGSDTTPLRACAKLQVNGAAVSSITDINTHDQEDSGTTVLALHLKSGDQVSVNMPSGCYLCDNSNHYNTFSAFLLYFTP